jgi:nucleoside-diphosphate-sugar epimerase
VFVTGATSGIGLATANLLRDTGFRTFAIDLSSYRGSAYEAAGGRFKRKAVRKGRKGQPPQRVAEAILHAPTVPRPPSPIRIHRRRASRLFYALLPLISDRMIDRKVEEIVWK